MQRHFNELLAEFGFNLNIKTYSMKRLTMAVPQYW